MSFRRKLLTVFAFTVLVSVVSVAWIISTLTRRAFERANAERIAALVAQFRREFNRRGGEIVRRVEAVASSDAVVHVAVALRRNSADYAPYINEAQKIASAQQLDFLEIVDSAGTIISSAESPAKFGYKEPLLRQPLSKTAFLANQELSEGAVLELCATRAVEVGDNSLYVIGGRRLDKEFLAELDLPSGTRAMIYQNVGPDFVPNLLIDSAGSVTRSAAIAPIVQQVQRDGRETAALVHWSSDPADDELIEALPLLGQDRQLLGALLVGNSRRPYVELRQRIRSVALLTGSAGIILAILLSGWAASRVTRPVEQLAEAARKVASGDWTTQVAVTSSDELGDLAGAFNRMTRELLEQREHLVQAERVAAWRELARRLAHELKNPLFPLQLTVENLLRARQQSPEQFEEIFQESSATLLAEIANLKGIISRFSEFSKMPQPQFQFTQLNDVVQNAARLYQAQLGAHAAAIECKLDLAEPMQPIAVDPELLHRAISNLVLNAMDAMPQGGTLTLRTRQDQERSYIEVSDTGTGLTREECERIFTPYYTSKAHGTGLGLAIVQSVISDHGGRTSVASKPGQGTTFVIELPANLDKLQAREVAGGSFGATS